MIAYYQSLITHSLNALRKHYTKFILPAALLFLLLYSSGPLLLFVPVAAGLMVRAAILALEPDREWSRGYSFIRLISHWLQHLLWAFLLAVLPIGGMIAARALGSTASFTTMSLLTALAFFLLSLRLWPLMVSNFLAGQHEFNSEIIGFPGFRDQWVFWGVGARVIFRWTRFNKTALYTTVPALAALYFAAAFFLPALMNWPLAGWALAAACFLAVPWAALILVIAAWLALLHAEREVPEFNLFGLIGSLKIEIPAGHLAPRFFRTPSLIEKTLRKPPAELRQIILSPRDFDKFMARMTEGLPLVGKFITQDQNTTFLIYENQQGIRESDPPDIVVGLEDRKGVIIAMADRVSALAERFNRSMEKWCGGISLGGDLPRRT